MSLNLYIPTARDVRLLQDALEKLRHFNQSTTGRPAVPDEQGAAPDVYVAKTPDEGIDGLERNLTGTALDDVPGWADCTIYRILQDEDDAPTVEELTDVERRVYNLGTSPVPGGHLIAVIRDKTGHWLALPQPAGATRLILKGTLDETLWRGGYAMMSVWDWDGAYTGTATDDAEEFDTGEDVEVHDWLLTNDADSIAAGSKVIVNWINGRWYVANVGCP